MSEPDPIGAGLYGGTSEMINSRQRDLPEGALLLLHSVSLAPSLRKDNAKLLLFEDGRLYRANNAGSRFDVLVDAPFPEAPSAQLKKSRIASIEKALLADGFFGRPPIVRPEDEAVKDGGIDILLARMGDKIHEVAFVNVQCSLLELLKQLWNE